MPRSVFAPLLLFLAYWPAALSGAQHEHVSGRPDAMGKVQFDTSCSPTVQDKFNLAVATLHSFGYRDSAQLFLEVLKNDPTCSMAEWGIAMSHYRQLWDPPSGEDLRIGLEAAQKGLATAPKTQREREYLSAIQSFYQNADSEDHRMRAKRYEHSMEALRSHYPQDSEAAIFYALALIANSPLTDRTYANQKKATQILEPIFVKQPEHPGLAHYIIHANDHPALAQQALYAARRYAQIAPDSPHALHMPSHVFTRLGLWDESIASNLASAASARRQNLPGDELHALDYLAYAYLQTGRIAEARKLTDNLPAVQPGEASRYAGLYATAAIPARFAVERQQWKDAAALPLPLETSLDDRYKSTASSLYFARALGAARLGDAQAARADMQPLVSLREALTHRGVHDGVDQVNIQLKIVTAWITWAEGDRDAALREMKEAVTLEDATEIGPVSPGPLASSREMLGDMLLLAKQPRFALEAYESALRVSPERLRAEYGAAVSAEAAGLRQIAEQHYRKVLANCSHGDPDLPELIQAHGFFSRVPGNQAALSPSR